MHKPGMTETQRFTSDMVWVAVSQALVSLTGLVTLPALTRSYPAEIYGVWVQMLVTVGLLTPILTLHLTTATVRFLAAEEDREKRRRAFGAMLWPILGLSGLTLIVASALRENLSAVLFADPEYASLVPLTFAWVLLQALLLFSLSYLRARGMIKRLSLIQLAVAAVRVAVIVVLATSGYSLDRVVAVIVLGEAAILTGVFAMVVREIGLPRPALAGLRRYLSFSIPQIPTGALLWVIAASDRYFITHLLDVAQTGVYSASYTLGSLIHLFFMPISFVLLPSVSRFWERQEYIKTRSYFEYSTRLFLALAIPAVAGLTVLSQPLLGMLTTVDYMAGASLVLLVAAGTVLLGLYQINVHVILLVQRTRWLPLMIGAGAATNAGINMVLIPRIGIMAAAISTIVSYSILAAIVTVWGKRAVGYKMDYRFLGKVVGAAVVMAFCVRLVPITGAWHLILAIVAGAAVFALGLWLLRAFSPEDTRLIRVVVRGLTPGLLRRGSRR